MIVGIYKTEQGAHSLTHLLTRIKSFINLGLNIFLLPPLLSIAFV